MRSLLLISALALAGGLLRAADAPKENLYTLTDGRVVRGTTAAEDKDALTVEITSGSVKAQIKLAKADVKEVRLLEPQKRVPEADAQQPTLITPAPDAEAWAMLKRAASDDRYDAPVRVDRSVVELRNALADRDTKDGNLTPAEVAEILKNLDKRPQDPFSALKQAVDEADHESIMIRSRFPFLNNPLPYDSDPTYWDIYSPLWDGVYGENYRGLVYNDGVIPRSRARLQNLRDYDHFIFKNKKEFTSKELPGTWIFPRGKDYRPFEPLPIPKGAHIMALPLGPNDGYPVAPYYQQDGVLKGAVINHFPEPSPLIIKGGGHHHHHP